MVGDIQMLTEWKDIPGAGMPNFLIPSIIVPTNRKPSSPPYKDALLWKAHSGPKVYLSLSL